MSTDIDTGDCVRHTPSGEAWIVACVIGDRLSWCGWPEGSADLADCALQRKATPADRVGLLHALARGSGSDHRQRYAQQRLANLAQEQP